MKIQPFRLVSSHRLLTRLGPLLVATLALLPAAAQAQGAIEAWVQRYNGTGNSDDWVSAIAVDRSNNIIVTGLSYGSGSDHDYATIKYSNAGVALWTNRYNGPANSADRAVALAVDASNNVIVTGYSVGVGSSADYLTIKYSEAGVPLWTNRYNGPANSDDRAVALAVDGSNNVIVTGYSYGVGSSADYLTIKYSEAGVPLWTNRYDGPDNNEDEAHGVAVDADGKVVVTGQSRGSGSWIDYATIQYSSAGVPLWTNRYNGPVNDSTDMAHALAVDSSNNVVVTGNSYGTGSVPDYLTIKYSSAGAPLWTNRYNGPANGSDSAWAVAVDASNNVIVTGYSYGTGSVYDYLTIQYSSAGVPLWTNRYERVGNVFRAIVAIAVAGSNNVIVAGYSYGNEANHDYLTIAYSSAGVPLWTNRYNGPASGDDYPSAVAVDSSGNVFVTGASTGSSGGDDYATIKYSILPIITRQPLSRTNAIGTTASFTVEAAGGAPLTYQWRRQETNLVDGGNLSGVTTTNLLIANVQLADAAGYTVVVTNAYGSATSSVAQLTVTIPPSPGRFTRLAYSPDTGFSFIFRDATVGKPYRIQTSPSLAEGSWVDWLNFNYTGPMLLTDLSAAETTNKFYRAISP